MKRSSVPCCIGFVLSLTLSQVAVADLTAALSATLTRTDAFNVTSPTLLSSYSTACVWDSLGNLDSQSNLLGGTDTSASATIASAWGHTETTFQYLHSEGWAAAPATGGAWVSLGGPYPAPAGAGVQWAGQSWSFRAAADGTVRFDGLLDCSFDLDTNALGERAFGYLAARIQLWIHSPSSLWELCGDAAVQLNPSVRDGTDYYAAASGVPCSVTSTCSFAPGQEGRLSFNVETSAGAYREAVVPAPAAGLLGVVGMGIAGLRLRKYV